LGPFSDLFDNRNKACGAKLVECHFIEAAIHQSGNSSKQQFIKCTSSSNFQNCKQNFSMPSRSKVINDLLRESRNVRAKILDPQNNPT
jgi:uncharacterized surface protein with fasciclin (FAS1) repeats